MKRLLKNHIYPVDWLIIGYCSVMVVLLLAIGRPIGAYVSEILTYAGLGSLAALIVRFAPEDRGWPLRFIRLLYPALMFTAFYRTTGGTMFLVFDRFFDAQLVAFETSLFGMEPTLYIDRYLLNTWLNEIFLGSYFSYYFMLPGLLVPLFILRKDIVIRRALAAITLTFIVSYFLFFLYPIEGPRWHWMDRYVHSIDGPFFVQAVKFMIAKGAVRGGCMPSTHVAVSLVIMLFALRESRKLGWILIPINLGLAVGTFWGRFHYISDVFVGVAIALAATLLVWKFHYRFEPEPAYCSARIPRKEKYVA